MAEKVEKIIPRLQARYREEVVPAMREEFGYKNILQVPKLQKIVVNMGLGEAIQDNKLVEHAMNELTLIVGQKPVVRRARKSIAGFKLRAGMPIGVCATLRRQRMYEFFDRLTSVALPRIRDFQGVTDKAFDGRGNFTLGVTEQIIFPEIPYEKVDKIRGLGITIVTSARTDEEGQALLRRLGMPFKKKA
ncbi:MAG: 50S ribosomal protein L5 [Candidatus Schekmanbacteria bacterium]|nr:50S ribosomal protein L5 [Candidatus Schekmanbacteria bacterium]